MQKTSLFAAAALAVLALAPIAVATPAFAQKRQTTVTHIPDPQPSTYDCSDELGYLRRVHASELEPVVRSTDVWVTPICVDDRMFRSEGNAGTLRAAIASNEAMQQALQADAFRPEDVVGVRMTGEDTVILYVYPID